MAKVISFDLDLAAKVTVGLAEEYYRELGLSTRMDEGKLLTIEFETR